MKYTEYVYNFTYNCPEPEVKLPKPEEELRHAIIKCSISGRLEARQRLLL